MVTTQFEYIILRINFVVYEILIRRVDYDTAPGVSEFEAKVLFG